MSEQKLVLVTGATGSQGRSVVDALLEKGYKVRGLTRDADSSTAKKLRQRGVEVVAGDFNDQASLARAADGVDAIFAMATPFENGIEAETAQGIAITNAAREAGVGHLVYSSVANADQATGIPHFESKYEVEKHLASSGVPYTIIAPVYFMENLATPWSLPALRVGKISLALPADRPLQQIAVQDIGAFAAEMIERRESVFGQRYDIAGDELSGGDLAEIFFEVTGHKIQYEGFPPEALRSQGEDMALMFAWLRDTGYSADIQGLRRDFPEVPWLDFRSWLGEQDWSVLASPESAEAGWGG